MPKKKTVISLLVLIILSFVIARGLMTSEIVAGHDSMAYPVTQHQFHQNIKEGVIFPRWAPDMRYGYGHAKLQYRPPLLHYLAEMIFAITGHYVLSLNLAVSCLVFIAALGMFVFMKGYIKPEYALISAAAYITANYFLADIYLRGAYYEVAAYAWMPWILWSQYGVSQYFSNNHQSSTINQQPSIRHGARFAPTRIKKCGMLAAGAIFWCFLVCGHPQVAAFFMPLSFAYIILNKTLQGTAEPSAVEHIGLEKDKKILSILSTFNFPATADFQQLSTIKAILANIALCVIGFMLAAPYFYVALRELPYVRMQLFDLNLENYYRHFIDIKQLFFESWPNQYCYYSNEVDYLGRPIHPEMRGFNFWALVVLVIVPVYWFWREKGDQLYWRMSLFFYFWVIATIFIATPLAWSIWAAVDVLQTFNFPWRALNVTSCCVAVIVGLICSRLIQKNGCSIVRRIIVFVLLCILMVDAFPHSKGWNLTLPFKNSLLTSEDIRWDANIPQQFYTPKWVKNYATKPAEKAVTVVEGQGSAVLKKREAISWDIDIDAKTPSKLRVSHYYYPGWQLYGVGDKPLQPDISPEGLMVFNIPEGRYNAVLKFGVTTDRIIGYAFSFLGLLLLAIPVFLLKR